MRYSHYITHLSEVDIYIWGRDIGGTLQVNLEKDFIDLDIVERSPERMKNLAGF